MTYCVYITECALPLCWQPEVCFTASSGWMNCMFFSRYSRWLALTVTDDDASVVLNEELNWNLMLGILSSDLKDFESLYVYMRAIEGKRWPSFVYFHTAANQNAFSTTERERGGKTTEQRGSNWGEGTAEVHRNKNYTWRNDVKEKSEKGWRKIKCDGNKMSQEVKAVHVSYRRQDHGRNEWWRWRKLDFSEWNRKPEKHLLWCLMNSWRNAFAAALILQHLPR